MPKLFMASLGCAKNLVDAEIMLGETLDRVFSLELDPSAADVIVINTCGFIEEARRESREVIAEYLELKKQSGGRIKVAAAGCLAERCPDELLEEFPDLDAVWGLDAPASLKQAILDLDNRDRERVSGLGKPTAAKEGARLLTTLPSFAYLRISDGCDNRCNYCAIPLIRGGLKSRDGDAVVEEARELEAQGAKELVVIAQDTTAYGLDRPGGGWDLTRLLESLLDAVSVPRLRLLYAHPAHIKDSVVSLLLTEPRLCRYLDLPLQHIATNVLKRMGRGYDKERALELIRTLRGGGVTLRTTLLTGFPGETEADFLETLEVVRSGAFNHLGAFAYSPEEGTPAFGMEDEIPPEEAARRRDALLEAQRPVAFRWLDSRIGKKETLLADAYVAEGIVKARSRHEAPDADGVVFLNAGKTRPGDMVEACIKARDGYDLVADADGARGKRRRRR